MPKTSRDVALLVAEFHTHCHRALELRAKTILKVLEKTDLECRAVTTSTNNEISAAFQGVLIDN